MSDTTFLDDDYWAVGQTIANHESLAANTLQHRGFECLLLQCRVKIGRASRVVPLWPGYLILRIRDGHFWMAAHAPGVLRLLMRGDRPVPFPQAKFDELMSLRDQRSGLIRLPKQKSHATSNGFKRGDSVRILSGSFRGLTALYEGQTSQERVIVLLAILGGQSRVTLAPDGIEAIASQ